MKSQALLIVLSASAILSSTSAESSLKTYSSFINKWSYGTSKIGIGDQNSPYLVQGTVNKAGKFTLMFFDDKSQLEDFLYDSDLFIVGNDKNTKTYTVKASNQDFKWRSFSTLYFYGNSSTNNFALRKIKKMQNGRKTKIITSSFIYLTSSLKVTGEAVGKDEAFKTIYEIDLPKGWSEVEEVGEYTDDENGNIIGKITTYRNAVSSEPDSGWNLYK